jgi:ketosteroid isomerase-like protein
MAADLEELERRLRALEDERAILHTLYAYAHSIDYGDEALFVDCWAEDAVLEWPWREPMVGHEALTAAFRGHTHAPDVYHKHFMVEPRIAVAGDHATVECYYAKLDESAEGPRMSSFGRYRDVLRRGADGRWRFASRRGETEARVPGNR